MVARVSRAMLVLVLVAACGGEAVAMKITFKQSGGFAGNLPAKTCELDTEALAGGDGARLRALVESSGLPKMDSADLKFETGADMQTYDITIESGQGSKRFSFDDMNVPEKAYPLLEFLQEKCQ